MTAKKPSVLFKIIKVVCPKTLMMGSEKLPNETVIIVSTHCQMNGTIVGRPYVPGDPQFVHAKPLAAYGISLRICLCLD